MRIAMILAVCTLIAAPARAQQRIEASGSIGYGTSEGIDVNPRAFFGTVYDSVVPNGGTSYNLTGGVLATHNVEVEFLFAHQSSRLDAEGPNSAKLPLEELSIYNYHGNFVYNWGEAALRPFAFGGLGATSYSFGTVLVAGPAGGTTARQLSGETKFSSTWGAGIKYFFAPNVGAKVMVRWTPTYIKSDPAGFWCDPYYGCWNVADPKYSHQFETSVGATVRF